MTSADPELASGPVDRELAGEFPGLAVWSTRVAATQGRSPASVRNRLRTLAGRITGGHVVHMRQDPVPWAYRVFWRQVGLDPDVDRPPAEWLAVERLRAGELPSRGLPVDALTIATIETGVPVVALDAGRVGDRIGLRTTSGGESLGDGGLPLSDGAIVVADQHHALCTLTGDVAPSAEVGKKTTGLALVSVQVPNVPQISVEEALWTAAETLAADR